jgi:hypothetical protein
MPRVPKVDRGSGVSFEGRWLPPPSLPMCEPAQILDSGEDRRNKDRRVEARAEARPQWPFLYSYRGNTVIVNQQPTKSKYQEACAVGVALI